MKLAEALQIRADLQKRIAQMPMRLNNNAKVQEGSSPSENPQELLDELNRLLEQLEQLVVKINIANSRVVADDLTPRHTLTEIRVISTVNVAELRKKCDALSKELRELEIKIQSLNWTLEMD